MAINKPKKAKKTRSPGSGSQNLSGYNSRQGKSKAIKTQKTNDLFGEQIDKQKRRQALANVIKTKKALAKITGMKPKSTRTPSQLRAIYAKKK